ncbi:unnamed protein product [Adineta steineri]|uniref:phosphoribosylaminoimidazole carboxylase n=1 Tax=Adineta steineri TaxID=433720 RepID=A0A819EIV4_9BILA|nr:unnamed protein product [Adineta steineri]CAF3851470.1 unnamed protein product [Adineta steineri]
MVTISYGEHWSNTELSKVLANDQATNLLTRISEDKFQSLQSFIGTSQMSIVRIDLPDLILSATDASITEFNSLIDSFEAHIINHHVYDTTLNIILHRNSVKKFCENLRILKTNENENQYVIGLISAGLSEMALICMGFLYLTILGIKCQPRIDYGVDRIRRINTIIEEFNTNLVNIVTAGMEGALFSVVAELSTRPLLCVPSNVSYGYGKDGEASMISLIYSNIAGQGIFNNTNMIGACNVAANIISVTKKRRQLEYYSVLTVDTDEPITYETQVNIAQKLRIAPYIVKPLWSSDLPRQVLLLHSLTDSTSLNDCINILKQMNSIHIHTTYVTVGKVILMANSIKEQLIKSDCVILHASNGHLPVVIGGIIKEMEAEGNGIPLIAFSTNSQHESIKSIVNSCSNNVATTNSMISAAVLALSILFNN